MAALPGAVVLVIRWLAAHMAAGDHVVSDPLPQTLIKHKVLAYELAGKLLFLHLADVVYDTAMELVDVFETLVPEPGAGFFAANPPRAVEQDFMVFLAF